MGQKTSFLYAHKYKVQSTNQLEIRSLILGISNGYNNQLFVCSQILGAGTNQLDIRSIILGLRNGLNSQLFVCSQILGAGTY